MIDILFLTYNRLEFTRESLRALIANTEWPLVRRLVIYDDGSTDGTREYLKSLDYPVEHRFVFSHFGGPVAVTNDYLRQDPAELFAKIDNDIIVPPGWLGECLKVMDAHQELDLLGIEAWCKVEAGEIARGYKPARHIGGIGLMRRRCFTTFPHANGRFGFTQWQMANKTVVKGWIRPSLPVIVLDKLPLKPWAILSRQYIAKEWQRKWPAYTADQSAIWSWWIDETRAS